MVMRARRTLAAMFVTKLWKSKVVPKYDAMVFPSSTSDTFESSSCDPGQHAVVGSLPMCALRY